MSQHWIPFVAAMVVVAGCGGFPEVWRARAQGSAWALIFAVVCERAGGHLRFPPVTLKDALVGVAILVAAFIWIDPKTVYNRYFARGVFGVAILAWLLWPLSIDFHFYGNQRNGLAFFFLAMGVWSIAERNLKTVQPLTFLTLSALTIFGFGVVTQRHALLELTALAHLQLAILAGVAVVALMRPSRVSGKAVVPFSALFAIAFLIEGHFAGHLNPWLMLELAAPFVALWIRSGLGFVPQKPPLTEALALGALAALPIAYFLWAR